MVQHHYWTVEDIENLIPFERDLYVDFTTQYIKKQEEEQKRAHLG